MRRKDYVDVTVSRSMLAVILTNVKQNTQCKNSLFKELNSLVEDMHRSERSLIQIVIQLPCVHRDYYPRGKGYLPVASFPRIPNQSVVLLTECRLVMILIFLWTTLELT